MTEEGHEHIFIPLVYPTKLYGASMLFLAPDKMQRGWEGDLDKKWFLSLEDQSLLQSMCI